MSPSLAPAVATSAEAGFSLSEALVAVFLLALAAMVVVGTLPARPVAGISAAERLRHDFEDIRDIAIISGQVQGIRLNDDGYAHVKWMNGDWVPASRSPVRFKQKVTIAPERAPPRSRIETKATPPEIVFDPTGIVAAPNLVLRWDRSALPLSVLPDGKVVWDSGNV